jgi:integrase
MRRPNAELRTREHLTTQEGEALIEAAGANRQGHRDALMILLAFRHGLRASEVCDLRWEQIDFKAATLHVRRTKPRIVVNGMDRPRSRPRRHSECRGPCQEKERRHASHVHRFTQ